MNNNNKAVFLQLKINNWGRYSSGQRGQTVTLLFLTSQVRILLSPLINAGVAQLVERQPSKLNVASSTLVSRSNKFNLLAINLT